MKADKDEKYERQQMTANFVTLADEVAKTAEEQKVEGSVYRERKLWTLSAGDHVSELPSSSEIELV